MIDNLLDYVEKYKFAILGTVLVHIIFLFYTTFATLEKPYGSADPETEILIPLDNVEFDPKIMEMLELTKNDQESQEIANLSADQNDQRERSYENFSTQEMDEQVESDARELEKTYFEEWASTHESNGGNSSNADVETEKNNQESNKNPDNNTIHTEGSNAYAGEVMVSYSLTNRKAHSLPRPGYTCNSSGTVVVDVKVDKNGDVKSATYNAGKSRGADECMVEKALRYAKKSRFNYSAAAPGSQDGTITYKFVSK